MADRRGRLNPPAGSRIPRSPAGAKIRSYRPEDRKPGSEAVIDGSAQQHQRLGGAGGGDHQRHDQRQQDQRHEQVAGPGVDRHRGDQRAGRGEAEVGEDEDDDQRRQRGRRVPRKKRAKIGTAISSSTSQVDEQRRGLGGEEGGAVDRGEADRVEAALLALGDEEAVDAEHGGEQQGRPEDAGGEAAGEVVRSRPKRKMTKVVIAKSAIAGTRLQRAQLGAQVLGEDRREGGARGGSPALEAGAARSMPSALRSHLVGGLGQEEALGVVGDERRGCDLHRGPISARASSRPSDVEVGVGLIEQQQLRFVQDATADREPLAHPGRELCRPARRRGAASRPRRAAPRSAPPARSRSIPCSLAWKRRFSRPVRSR